jgi:CxxC motif-containing protein (DUF1111 family)
MHTKAHKKKDAVQSIRKHTIVVLFEHAHHLINEIKEIGGVSKGVRKLPLWGILPALGEK